jgi:predicted branched-subunit amino acid permease
MSEVSTVDAAEQHRGAMADGARAILPTALGIAPFGLALGATIATADVDTVPALSAAVLLFGGSAQLAVVQMLDAGAAPVLVVVAALMINVRFAAYSAALAPVFPTSRRTARAAIAATLVDQTYLVTTVHAAAGERSESELRRFYAGASATIGLVWVCAQVIGVLAGTGLPAAANLGAAAPISLAGLAASIVSDRVSRLALGVAAVGLVVLSTVAGQLALILAIVAGVAVAATVGPSDSEADR